MTKAIAYKILLGVILVVGTLLLADTWFDIFSDDMLGKVLVSAALVAVMAGAVAVIRQDIDAETKRKDEGFYN
ncbi:MAG: hypothetical protein EBZ69_05220 [Alphaproteobacteria bacterium]|nr:hypothetical protein [Alphaproteobacteria bacterium]NDC56194.1 hypothetical protein [Alphaproteobacteria bacterium]NDG03971.1 hypothetical protein [Alphaproteobacteria bacterium]